MIRTFLKRSLAASAVVAGGGTAYVLSDKRARRSLSFWTKIGPIVGSYVSTGVSFKYLRAKEREENKAKWKADRSAAFGKLHEENAPKVLQAIIQLRGIFIKAGQYLSVRPELTPAAYRREFKTLQTAAPSESKDVIVKVIEKELGAPCSELFESIADKPCGSASTAQAHIARLKGSGRRVVVKVQYPDAEEMFKSDIVSLSQLARLMRWLDSEASSSPEGDLESVLKEFSKQFLSEFDYEAEASNMREIGDALRAHPKFSAAVAVPEVIPSLCSRRVVTMTFLEGPTLEQKASALLSGAGVDLRAGVKNLLKREKKATNLATAGGGVGEDSVDVSNGTGSPVPPSGFLATLARRAVSLVGPDAALVVWGAADWGVRLCQRVAIWCILDAWPALFGNGVGPESLAVVGVAGSGGGEESSGGADGGKMRQQSDSGPLEDEEALPRGWVQWAQQTRARLDELAALSHVGEWILTLIDVHGFEVFDIGLFNGDPHPGNILVLPDQRLGLIDYGQCKRLSPASKRKLANLICVVADEGSSNEEIAAAFRDVGLRTVRDDPEFMGQFARLILGRLRSEHLEPKWHHRLHKSDRVVAFPADLLIMVRVVALLRGLGLVLKTNVDVAKRWEPRAREVAAMAP